MFLFMFAAVLVTCVLVIHISLFKEINDMANKVGQVGKETMGLDEKSTVALMMGNSVDFVCIYLGN